MTGPAVSVVVLAYQHGAYLAQALDSIWSQDLEEPFEVLIADDASTDNTSDVLAALNAPGHITVRILPRETNVGMITNLTRAWAQCQGPVIALLEGDDFWTSPSKLTLQLAALRQHPRATLCTATTVGVTADGTPTAARWPQHDQREISATALATRNFIGTASVAYRAGIVPTIPAWFTGLPMADWPLHLLHAAAGDIVHIPANLAAYRSHPGGMWSTGTFTDQAPKSVRMLRTVLAHTTLPPAMRRAAQRSARHMSRGALIVAARTRSPRTARRTAVAVTRAWTSPTSNVRSAT